jgi:hypothetical protein
MKSAALKKRKWFVVNVPIACSLAPLVFAADPSGARRAS